MSALGLKPIGFLGLEDDAPPIQSSPHPPTAYNKHCRDLKFDMDASLDHTFGTHLGDFWNSTYQPRYLSLWFESTLGYKRWFLKKLAVVLLVLICCFYTTPYYLSWSRILATSNSLIGNEKLFMEMVFVKHSLSKHFPFSFLYVTDIAMVSHESSQFIKAFVA